MSGNKIGPAEKLLTVHLILNGKETQGHAADRLGIDKISIRRWIYIYKSDGEGVSMFLRTNDILSRYIKYLKKQAAPDYQRMIYPINNIPDRYTRSSILSLLLHTVRIGHAQMTLKRP